MRGTGVILIAPVLPLAIACATALEPELDGTTVGTTDASSAVSTGGAESDAPGDGGEPSSVGGSPGVGGAEEVGNGGEMASGGAMGACPPDQKSCGGICIKPAPSVGCSLSGCTPCPSAPDSATAICQGDQCAIECAEGYMLTNGMCVESNGAAGMGQGGAMSSGGSQGCSFSKGDACTECACSRCRTQVDACTASGSPCTSIIDCGVNNHCASTSCYCGSDALCLAPAGPCVQEIQAAAGTMDALQILGFQGDTSHPIGQADAAGLCMQSNCASECGL